MPNFKWFGEILIDLERVVAVQIPAQRETVKVAVDGCPELLEITGAAAEEFTAAVDRLAQMGAPAGEKTTSARPRKTKR